MKHVRFCSLSLSLFPKWPITGYEMEKDGSLGGGFITSSGCEDIGWLASSSVVVFVLLLL